jgi:flavin reductase (DIM6/NTAB) family NADH-FMN oxidoreductase RutF
MMEIDPDTLDSDAIYKILIGSVLPRPIGWASTISADGVANLAPFSFFTFKDTLINVRETGEFVINVVSLPQVNHMHMSSAEHPSEADEFEVVGLGKLPSITVRPPRVEGAPVAMECKVETILPLGEVGDHLVIGRVTRFHIRDDLWMERGRLDTAALQPVGRLAAEYTLANTVFACPIPDDMLVDEAHRRMRRIDQKDSGWSPLDDKNWSAAGNATKLEG